MSWKCWFWHKWPKKWKTVREAVFVVQRRECERCGYIEERMC